MKIATVIGARPQFIKAAAVTRAIRKYNRSGNSASRALREVIIHTGQHFDRNMSEVFFRELDIPAPDYGLEVRGLSHGAMTGQMLEKVETVLFKERPHIVLVYGDTNSTLSGALAAVKLHIPVAHVEAGLRSFNRRMPEEINRVLTDHLATWLFCPTERSVRNLKKEGISKGVARVGDVMLDLLLFYAKKAEVTSVVLDGLGIRPKQYGLVTMHRQENTDDVSRLKEILEGLTRVSEVLPLIWPVHPRNLRYLEGQDVQPLGKRFKLIEPLGYLDFIQLEKNARVIFTDSGGVQKEAFFFNVPCITLRDETEWVETVEGGGNMLVGVEQERIMSGFLRMSERKFQGLPCPFGDGDASGKIVAALLRDL